MLEAKEQFGRSLHLELHTAGTEYLIRRTDVKLHVGDVELLLIVMLLLANLLLPVSMHQLLLRIGTILLGRHHIRRSDLGIAYLGAQHVHTALQIILHLRLDILRLLEVHAALRSGQLLIVLAHERRHLHRCPQGRVAERSGQRSRGIAGFGILRSPFTTLFLRRLSRLFLGFLGFFPGFLGLLLCLLFRHQFLERLGFSRLGYHHGWQPQQQYNI